MKKILTKNYISINHFILKNKGYNSKILTFNTEYYLKQALKIIYEYHITKKKILFIGFPKIKNINYKLLLKKTRHYFIKNNAWVNGLMSNRTAINTYVKNLNSDKSKKKLLKNYKILLNIKNKPDLLVLFQQYTNPLILKEFYNLKIPIILFNDDKTINENNYEIKTNLTYNIKKFYSFLIYSLFKRILYYKSNILPNVLKKKKIKKILTYNKLKYLNKFKYFRKFKFFKKSKKSKKFNKKYKKYFNEKKI